MSVVDQEPFLEISFLLGPGWWEMPSDPAGLASHSEPTVVLPGSR